MQLQSGRLPSPDLVTDVPGAIWHPSPNFGDRRGGLKPELIVLHYTAMDNADAALERLCDPVHEVSSHYLVGRQGQLWQLVAEDMRAWHAGAGGWRGREDVNSRSIGIEIDNDGRSPFSELALVRLESLLDSLLERYRLTPEAVIGHSDIAPERKHDPGPRFDWRRLARNGLAVWPDPLESTPAATPEHFARACRVFGYPDAPHVDLLRAVRSRFRPVARGALDACDMALIGDLAARFPAPEIDPAPANA